jgi:hypothetical protein
MRESILYIVICIIGIASGLYLWMIYSWIGALIACGIIVAIAAIFILFGYIGEAIASRIRKRRIRRQNTPAY